MQKDIYLQMSFIQRQLVSPSDANGTRVQIMAGAILQTNVSIADNTIINTGSIIDHDCNNR